MARKNERSKLAESLQEKSSGDRKPFVAHDVYFEDEQEEIKYDNSKEEFEEIVGIGDEVLAAAPKRKKPKFEDTHTKHTIWMRDDLMKEVNKITHKTKGEKTRFFNEAIYRHLLYLKEQSKKK